MMPWSASECKPKGRKHARGCATNAPLISPANPMGPVLSGSVPAQPQAQNGGTQMKRYNHLFSIAFEIESGREDASDLAHVDYVNAIVNRAYSVGNLEMEEAVGAPLETNEVEA